MTQDCLSSSALYPHANPSKSSFEVHREATAKVIKKAMRNEPTIDWLLENQDKVTYYVHELGLKGEL
jgi:5,6,7,8-tetrahydromethanopterin hydro-lyase